VLNIANHEHLEDLKNVPNWQPSYFSTIGLLLQDCHHVEVRYCNIGYWPGTGLRASGCDYLTIDKNIIHNNSRRSAAGNHGMMVHSSYQVTEAKEAAGGDDKYTIKVTNNVIYENYNQISSWSPIKTIVHYGDNGMEAFDEGYGCPVQKANNNFKMHRVLVANNIIARNGKGAGTNTQSRVTFVNNVLYENHITDFTFQNAGLMFSNGGTELIAANNIITLAPNATGLCINRDATTGGPSGENNICTHSVRVGLEALRVSGMPAFNNAGAYDFRLVASSVGASVPSHAAVADDILGNTRGTNSAAGCYAATM
jgi:hypothetical protein